MSDLSLPTLLSWTSGSPLVSMLPWLLLGGVLSLAPAVLLMTTCFVRFSVVLNIVRHGFNGVQFPPGQVVTALSLFLTLGVMWPVWSAAWREGVVPYTQQTFDSDEDREQALAAAVDRTLRPLQRFMSAQIDAAENGAAVDLLLMHQAEAAGADPDAPLPEFYEDLPLSVLLPAYVLSELQVAFALGFQLLLPFVVIDIVTSSVIQSLGITSLPAAWIAFPLKLLAFVITDGWFLVVETLLAGVQAAV